MKHTTVLLIFALCTTTTIRAATPKEEKAETIVLPCYRSFVGLLIAVDAEELIGDDHVKMMVAKALKDRGEYIVFVSNYLLNKISYFDANNGYAEGWDARCLSNNISVLIPKDSAAWRTRSGYPAGISDDYLFGIRISDKKKLKKDQLSDKRKNWESLSKEALQDLKTLFIPRAEYLQKSLETRVYNLVFLGHGLPPIQHERPTTGPIIHLGGRIAGLAVGDLRAILFTLAGRHLTRTEELAQRPEMADKYDLAGIINIASLTLVSCFTGDLNALATFSKSQMTLGETYDFTFPIILVTPLATVTTVAADITSFPTFFNSLLKNCGAPDFAQAISAIFETVGENIPVIKKPGIPRFFPLDPARHIEIGDIMGEARTKTIHIPSDFKKTNIDTILIHAPIIRAPVFLERMAPLPPIFSSKEGPSSHDFVGGMDASSYPFTEIINAFTSSRQAAWKAFRFSKITAIDDVVKKDGQARTFDDVFIINYVVPYQKAGFIYQRVLLTIAYTLDGKRYINQKEVPAQTGIAALGGEIASGSGETEKLSEEDVQALWHALQEMVKNPTVTGPERPPIAIDKLTKLLEKRGAEESGIERLAQSLQVLSQQER